MRGRKGMKKGCNKGEGRKKARGREEVTVEERKCILKNNVIT